MKDIKKVGLVLVLDEIKNGLSPTQISRKYNVAKQNISYFVGKLKESGCIRKKGYGVWEYIKPLKEVKNLTITQSGRSVLTSFDLSKKKKEIRGHAFIWKIQFYNPILWEKIINSYKKKNLTFQFMSYNKQFRTIFKSRKIWLGKKGLTIYEPIDFMGRSSFEVKGKAVFEMDLLIKELLAELGQKNRPYRFTTSREHYGIVKNELARQYNDKKEKMEIRSEDGSIWMWIDDSKSLGELENNEALNNRRVQNYWNNHKKHKFKVDADYTLEAINKLTVAQIEGQRQLTKYEEQNKEHLALIQLYKEESEFNKKVMIKILEKLDKL